MQISLNINEILEAAEAGPGQVDGACEGPLTGIATLAEAGPADLAFLGNRKYRGLVPGSRAGLIILPENYEGTPRAGQAFLRVANPTLALARVCARVEALIRPTPGPGVHSSAVVHPLAQVNPTASIGPLCIVEEGARIGPRTVLRARSFVGHEAVIGEACLLHPGATLCDHCQIGDRVVLQPGAIIGGDGFGFEKTPDGVVKLPQIGGVVLENDVEVGANTTIDRARFGQTRVGEGTKIDNLVMVAHNCVIGRNCFIISQVGISGSTRIEDGAVLGGQAGLVGHITIGKGAMVGAQSGINNDLEPGAYVRGSPAMPVRAAMRVEALSRRLPELFKRVESLESLARQAGPGEAPSPGNAAG